MFCPKCGRPVEGEARFCPSCGAPLEPGVSAATRAAELMWEATKTTLAHAWVGGASLTLIAVYLVFCTVSYGLGALVLGIMSTVPESLAEFARRTGVGEIPIPPAQIRGAGTLLSFVSVVLVVATVLAGAGAIGLFARQLWGRMVTRAFLALDVMVNIVALLLFFSASTFVHTLFAVVAAVFIWIHLRHPRVEALLKPEE